MIWRQAILNALHRFSARHGTRLIDRQSLISEEMEQIVDDTHSQGQTPEQTLSRELQELEKANVLHRIARGSYLLLDAPINVEQEELPDDAMDFAVQMNKLQFGIVPTDDAPALARRRHGQDRVRVLTLKNYDYQCGFCDIHDEQFLIASHIARWADEPESRGDLANVICLCKLHDPLFEAGYLALADDYCVLKKQNVPSTTIQTLLNLTKQLRVPRVYQPSPQFLKKHRIRTGFKVD